MTLFLILGVVGIVLLVASLILDDLLDSVFDSLFDSFDAGGYLGGPAIFSFLAAFGFGGALALNAGIPGAGAVAIGVAAGLGLGAGAGFITRSLMHMPTDTTVAAAHYVGVRGTVITPIPSDGLGEVSITIGGQPLKLSARSADAIGSGTPIVVTAVLSPTSVLVDPLA